MIEILYHTLWETVHVFFEHRELGTMSGDAGFLYPFLGQAEAGRGRFDRGGGRIHSDEGRGRRAAARAQWPENRPSEIGKPPPPFTSAWRAAAS